MPLESPGLGHCACGGNQTATRGWPPDPLSSHHGRVMKRAILLLTVVVSIVATFPAGAQEVREFNDRDNKFVQEAGGPSVRGVNFNFRGGNDQLVLLRNDDLAGLGRGPVTFGAADMGEGRDIVITSFNMSGEFLLGGGDDVFYCDGNQSFTFDDVAVSGGPGNDVIAAATELGAYLGDDGDDRFASEGRENFFGGGPGSDTYSVEGAASPARIDLLQRTSFVVYALKSDQLDSIENVRGSPFADEIFGDGNPNRIDGLAGDDSIDGDTGNDTIAGGPGTNTLIGGLGIDTLVVDGAVSSKNLVSGVLTVTGVTAGAGFRHTATGFEQVLDNNVLKSVSFFAGQTPVNTVQQTVIAEAPVLPAIEDAFRIVGEESPVPVGLPITSVKILPPKRTVTAGKSAKVMVMVANNTTQDQTVQVTFASSNTEALSVPLSQSLTVPGKKNAKQKAKTARLAVLLTAPASASGASQLTATVAGITSLPCSVTIKAAR